MTKGPEPEIYDERVLGSGAFIERLRQERAYNNPDDAKLRNMLYEWARARQAMLVNRADLTATMNNYQILGNWIGCILKHSGDDAPVILSAINAEYINTLDRIKASFEVGRTLHNVVYTNSTPVCEQ